MGRLAFLERTRAQPGEGARSDPLGGRGGEKRGLDRYQRHRRKRKQTPKLRSTLLGSVMLPLFIFYVAALTPRHPLRLVSIPKIHLLNMPQRTSIHKKFEPARLNQCVRLQICRRCRCRQWDGHTCANGSCVRYVIILNHDIFRARSSHRASVTQTHGAGALLKGGQTCAIT